MTSLAYVGSVSSRLDMIIAANSARTPGPGSPDEVRARKPFPYMVTTQYGTDLGRASYKALQAKVHRTFQGGLYYLIAYTWSKSIDNGASGWYGRGPQDSYNPASSQAVSDYDRTHVLTISGIYELPFGPRKLWLNGGALSRIFGGWQLNMIATAQSGAPFDLVVPGDVANVGNLVRNYARPNLAGNPYPAVRSTTLWYDPRAFRIPSFSFGNFGRNVLRTAPAYGCDLSVFRLFPLGEQLRGEMRLEAFNALNRMNPGTPETNITNGNAGRITTLFSRPRELQIALRLVF